MNISTFNLETARLTPENMATPYAKGDGVAAVIISAESPASIYVDSLSSDPVPAVPGLVLRDFTQLYLQNEAGGGALTVAYYQNCGPIGSPSEVPYYPVLDYAVNNVVAPSVQLTVPGPEWCVVIASVSFSLSDVQTFEAYISAQTPSVPTGAVRQATFYMPDGPASLHVTYPKPLIFGRGRDVTVVGPRGTATPSTVSVQGAYIRS